MRILKETHIDFLGKRYLALALSTLMISAGLISLVINGGPNLGIDFAGGSQIVVRFAEPQELDAVRDVLAEAGLENASIQEFEADSNEILIRTPGVLEGQEIDTAVATVSTAMDRLTGAIATDAPDLNAVDRDVLVGMLLRANPNEYDLELQLEGAETAYCEAVRPILDLRADIGVISDWSQVEALGMDPAVLDIVRDGTRLSGYAIINSESVGPQVGQDLRRQTTQAILWALVGMLAYISYRFEFKFGVAAVIALVHDVTIALGAFSLTGREFNLPVVAAFLTIVGYSLNDTVVVFDRIRENSTALRRASLFDRINTSLNQTLSRTLLTSGTTMIVVLSLFFYGGPVINDFSFALLVGIVVGTYSSLFVASPIVYVWQQRDAARRRK
jgi:preprotein translocase subunit SecF